MKSTSRTNPGLRDRRNGGVVTALAGGILLLLSPHTPIEHASYDLLFLLQPAVTPDEAVIVAMDEISYANLEQSVLKGWDRKLHAQLLDRLTRDQATAVVFDVIFDEPLDAEGDQAFASAISRHGKVVLAADTRTEESSGFARTEYIRPDKRFRDAGAATGLIKLQTEDGQSVIRRHHPGNQDEPSLSWKAAEIYGAAITSLPRGQDTRWINFYGPDSLPHLSYYKALSTNEVPAGYFQDKVVFIGSRLQTVGAARKKEEFTTPYTGRTGLFASGLEMHALTFLNLVRRDWMVRAPAVGEFIGILLLGGFFGWLMPGFRPWHATGMAVAGMVVVFLVASTTFIIWHTWFAWLIVAVVQLPLALAFSLISAAHHRSTVPAPAMDVTADYAMPSSGSEPRVPDHEMIRAIGQGSYGEVWIARNVAGRLRAVKIIRRRAMVQDRSFDREFEGLKKFEPISRSHIGLVDILHAGRNNEAGYFYYIMELADDAGARDSDETRDESTVSDRYAPATLFELIERSGNLPFDRCVAIARALTGALQFLHENNLIHRDIKPSNIIFIDGQPKLADIGLVATAGEALSLVGTEGYIPPEGPGTPEADQFSLGRVLYQMCTGLQTSEFPQLPPDFEQRPDRDRMLPLMDLIFKAGDNDRRKRFDSMAAMNEALKTLA